MKILDKNPGSVWDDILLRIDWSIICPGVFRQLLKRTLEPLPRSQTWEPLVVSCPGVRLVEEVSVLLSVVVVRVVILISIVPGFSWSWRKEDRRQSPLKMEQREIKNSGKRGTLPSPCCPQVCAGNPERRLVSLC